MTKIFLTYFVTMICFIAIDMIWLQGIAKSFYAEQLSGLLRPKPIIWAAALFYILYPVGLTVFGILRAPDPANLTSVAISAALFGFFAYLTYDATNYSVARDFPLTIAIADTLWGTFASALACVVSVYIMSKLSLSH